MTIPQLRFVPDSPAPDPSRWNGGLRIDTDGTITACLDDGEFVDAGHLLTIRTDGTVYREADVNPSLGFALDSDGRIMLSASDPLMQPRAATTRQVCEFRQPKPGEWYWSANDWFVCSAPAARYDDRIVALGATAKPAYPPGCEPVEWPSFVPTVDGMTREQLDEVLASAHWHNNPNLGTMGPHPSDEPVDERCRTALTAPAYSCWLERTARTGKGAGNGA
jgi:hypothetical protein